MKVVLHIGPHKTGTTSIQKFLRANRGLLHAEGVSVGPNEWHVSHIEIFSASLQDRWTHQAVHVASRLGLDGIPRTSNGLGVLQARILDEFDHYVESDDSHTLVLSAEDLSTLRSEEIATCVRLLEDRELELIGVIMYVRHPWAWGLSLANLGVLNGQRLDISSIGTDWNMLDICERWESVLPGRIIVRSYDPGCFEGGDLVRDFCLASGIPWLEAYELPGRENESLPWFMMKVLNNVNSRMDLKVLTDAGTINPLRMGFVDFIRRIAAQAPAYSPSREQLRKVEEMHSEQIEELRRRFFSPRDAIWKSTIQTRDSPPDGDPSTSLSPVEESLANGIAALWRTFSVEVQESEPSPPVEVVNAMVDIALRIDEGTASLVDSLTLMRSAQRLRPHGPLIAAKIQEYERRLGLGPSE